MKLQQDFYNQGAEAMAPQLLGKLLCRQMDGQVQKYAITETECYCGQADTACHAHKGQTPRTQIMYQQGGKAYIYLCYGIHNLLNIVSGPKDQPEAVLIRGVEGFAGPGRLTKIMQISRHLNGVDLTTSEDLWLEDVGDKPEYLAAPRIGIGYAEEEDRNRLWRFTVKQK